MSNNLMPCYDATHTVFVLKDRKYSAYAKWRHSEHANGTHIWSKQFRILDTTLALELIWHFRQHDCDDNDTEEDHVFRISATVHQCYGALCIQVIAWKNPFDTALYFHCIPHLSSFPVSLQRITRRNAGMLVQRKPPRCKSCKVM